jgi:hypothetical protein
VLLTQHFARQNRLFPPSLKKGLNNGQQPKGYPNYKVQLMTEILVMLRTRLPMEIGEAHNIVYAHLMEMVQEIVRDDISTPLYGVVYEARKLLSTQGFVKLMDWFGITVNIQPITDLSLVGQVDDDGDEIDPVTDLIVGFGVKSADDD